MVAEQRKPLTAREREILGLGETDEPLELVILENSTIDCEFGWVFFYNSKQFAETGDFRSALAGNAPLIVTHNGSLFETGTAYPVEHYIENFRRFGSPHPENET